MADRLADSGELAVDELRRKARRRLVGAIVLALAAAIIVPMLLEDEPRPLGDDVSVRIPPLDQGKFVNKLTGGAPGASSATVTTTPETAPAGETSAAPSPAPGTKKSISEAEQRVLVPAEKAAAKEAPAPGAEESSREGEPKPASDAKTTTPSAAMAMVAPPAGGFVVQLAAFADDKGANALANKLRRANYAAYVEPVTTSRGTLWRVRVGGYASRPDADAARLKLKDEGYSGIVAPAK